MGTASFSVCWWLTIPCFHIVSRSFICTVCTILMRGCVGLNHPTRFHWKKLEEFTADVFKRAGVRKEHAVTVAESLVHADLRGIESHGVARMPIYVQRIQKGMLETNKEVHVVSQHQSSILVDGENMLGAVVGEKVLDLAVNHAKDSGIAAVGVRNSNHFGACSYYAQKAIQEGIILLVLSNAPQTMAPTGGIRSFFGSNPIAIGIPAGEETPFLLDMASSVVARGKIAIASKKGEAIPLGWALDQYGQPTTDAQAALEGSILPIGGPKGYGIAMFIDIICGVLTGAGYGESVYSLYDNWEKPQNVGHFFIAIHIDRFIPMKLFQALIDQYIRQIKAVPLASGVEQIFIPGELEHRTMLERRVAGIPLPPHITKELDDIGRQYQLDVYKAKIGDG